MIYNNNVPFYIFNSSFVNALILFILRLTRKKNVNKYENMKYTYYEISKILVKLRLKVKVFKKNIDFIDRKEGMNIKMYHINFLIKIIIYVIYFT